jgi:hypothetical protein
MALGEETTVQTERVEPESVHETRGDWILQTFRWTLRGHGGFVHRLGGQGTGPTLDTSVVLSSQICELVSFAGGLTPTMGEAIMTIDNVVQGDYNDVWVRGSVGWDYNLQYRITLIYAVVSDTVRRG